MRKALKFRRCAAFSHALYAAKMSLLEQEENECFAFFVLRNELSEAVEVSIMYGHSLCSVESATPGACHRYIHLRITDIAVFDACDKD